MKKFLLFILILLISLIGSSQDNRTPQFNFNNKLGVGVTYGTINPPGAWLIVGDSGTTKGMIIPRVQNTAAVTTPAQGMIVYSIDDQCLFIRSAIAWVRGGENIANGNLTADADRTLSINNHVFTIYGTAGSSIFLVAPDVELGGQSNFLAQGKGGFIGIQDSINLLPFLGKINIDSLATTTDTSYTDLLWKSSTGEVRASANNSSRIWKPTGNSVGVNGKFIGTNDNFDFAIKQNGKQRAHFTNDSTTFGDYYNAPKEYYIRYANTGSYSTRGVVINDLGGFSTKLHSITGNNLYLTDVGGSPVGITIGSITNPFDATAITGSSGLWTLNSTFATTKKSGYTYNINGSLGTNDWITKGFFDSLAATSAWGFTGNTVGANGKYIGTNDNFDFAIKINGKQKAHYTADSIVFGHFYNAPFQYQFNYDGSGGYNQEGLLINDVYNGNTIRIHAIGSNNVYFTNAAGSASGLTIGTISNPINGTNLSGGVSDWTLNSSFLSTIKSGYTYNINGSLGTNDWTTKGREDSLLTLKAPLASPTFTGTVKAPIMYLGGTSTPTALLHLAAGTAPASTAPLKLTTGPVNTTAEAGALEYTTPQLFFTNGGAQRQELIQSQQSRVTTQFDKTSSTSLSDITGLTATVVAGKTYRFEAKLYTSSNTSFGVRQTIAGTCTATNIIYEGITTDGTSIVAHTRATALGTSVGVFTAASIAYVTIEGTITVNAAGTLTVQFAQSASGASASSVLVGSTFVVSEML